MNSGIYKIKNKTNDKFYIGSTNKLDRRFYEHKCRLRSDTHKNTYLQSAWDKYGEENFKFEVIIYCSEQDLEFYEQIFLDEYNSYKKDVGYNLAKCVEAPNRGKEFTKEHKDKISKNHADVSGKNNPMYGKERDCEWLKGSNSPCSKLDEDDVREIKRLLEDDSIYQYEIAEEFDVDRATITYIKQGKTWTHVEA